MRFEPGFVTSLREELAQAPVDFKNRTNRSGGLSNQHLLSLVSKPEESGIIAVENPSVDNVVSYDQLTDTSLGLQALKAEQVALCVLAGGSGTRIGLPKALVRFSNGLSLLGMKLMQSRFDSLVVPLVLMVNPQIKQSIVDHCLSLASNADADVGAFEQFESYRLTPDNRFSIVDGQPELYPTGHGDMPSAIVESGVLEHMKQHGIKYVITTNVDNVVSAIDPILLTQHIKSGMPVTFQAVHRTSEDSSGVVVFADGKLQAVERFRLPESFDATTATLTNTNSFIANVEMLEDVAYRQWRYHRVRKNVNNRLVVQHERLIQQLTEFYDAGFVAVPRSSHYMPIKTFDDLEKAEKTLFSKW